jgi:hypothetical protein
MNQETNNQVSNQTISSTSTVVDFSLNAGETLIVEPILQERQRSDVLLTRTRFSLQVSTVSVVASPNSQEVKIDGNTTYNLQINRNNFSNNVEFREVLGLPSGVRTTIRFVTDSSPLPTTPSEAIDIHPLLGFDRD